MANWQTQNGRSIDMARCKLFRIMRERPNGKKEQVDWAVTHDSAVTLLCRWAGKNPQVKYSIVER